MTASRMVRRGSRASSARGAAASKPMKARIVYTDPAITPDRPAKPSTLAEPGPNTARVLSPPAWKIRVTASPANTRISNSPSRVPAAVLRRTPKNPRTNTITAAATADTTHQVS